METSDKPEIETSDNQEASKGWQNKGLMNFSDQEKQSVFQLFGFELTAPKAIKNPGAVYISFIVGNIILFVLLKSLIAN